MKFPGPVQKGLHIPNSYNFSSQLLIHEADSLLRTLHTSKLANRVIMAIMPQWFTAGTPGGGGAPTHSRQF